MDAELSSLRRSFQMAFTSIELSRRKWSVLSENGKRMLVDCTNSSLKLAYAEEGHWEVLGQCSEIRRCVAIRALTQHQASLEAVHSLLQVCRPPSA